MKIFIDVGHGGSDTGAVFGKLIERDMNLVVSLRLASILQDYAEIMLSRENNETYLSLSDRTRMANRWGADLLISVHHNAGRGDGSEIIHSVFTDLTIGDELAKVIVEEFKAIGQNTRKIYSKWNSKYNENYYGTIRNADMDSIITEFAFIDSMDNEIIDSYDELLAEGEAIARGVIRFFGLKSIKMDWDEILQECLDKPDDWIKTIDSLKEMVELNSNLGDLELMKYVDVLIEKVYQYGRNTN